MFRNLSTPKVILTLKPSFICVRAGEKLSNLTAALQSLGGHIANFNNVRKPSGGYEVRIFGNGENRVRTIAANCGFTVAHCQSF